MPLRDAKGDIVGTCGISKDFTAQKALEDEVQQSNLQLAARQTQLERALAELRATQQQLVEAEKMQMVGRLASGVAHEIRNPLNILHAGLDFLAHEQTIAGDQSNAVIMEEMRTAVRRADAVICALMDSSAEASLRLEPCDVREVLSHALAAQEAELRHAGIRISREFAGDLPMLALDRAKMEQVFGSMIKNAADAMSGGGQLTLRARRHTLGEAEVERDPGGRGDRLRADDAGVCIEIEDTGAGIPAEVLPRVFDPFFTTKETGAGAGLGLTVCRKIVQLHHGTLQLANRAEGGVRARIFLKAGDA
jgi:signal transduction histidine kinase